jgi:hypothetical protein
MMFLFTFWPKAEYQGIALTSMGATYRLVSYYYARQLGLGFLERYVADGVVVSDETEALAAILRPYAGGEHVP